jgi:hypothetical protein
VSDAPVAPLTRGLSYQVTDGSGGTSTAVNQTITIVPVNDAPVIGGIATSGLVYSVVAGPALLAEAATVNDVDSAALGGGILSVALTAGGLATDRLTVVAQGTGPGQIGLSGSVVTFAGVAIGSWSGGVGTTALSIALNGAATAEGVQALLRRIAFSSVATDPTSGGLAPTRTIRFTLSDAAASAGGQTTTVFQSIGVGA